MTHHRVMVFNTLAYKMSRRGPFPDEKLAFADQYQAKDMKWH